ncbi:POU domain, class 4, transcription factor 2 [Drosophila santomea]|uniref:POU domain, class 4, transcription factor 2 n=1 Tax=Drosophila santomea TaxID=129105 RepID=UPI001953327B|nr:POU domain, class 4, transcription factor 2 [Drosophila santomea]
MPRKKRASSPMDMFDDDFDEDASSQSSQPPVQRNAANARERMRMRVLSSAYGRLKTKLPNIPPDTKLSKLDTLRLATLYIKQLITAVETGSHSQNHPHHPHHHSSSQQHLNHSHSSTTSSDGLDTSHMADSSGGGNYHFHNNGHGMSWPFEFHQSSRSLAFAPSPAATSSARMDWQALHPHPQSYPKSSTRSESHVAADLSYHQLPESHSHWYPAEVHQMEPAASCSYDSGMGQHQRGIAIATSHAHGI